MLDESGGKVGRPPLDETPEGLLKSEPRRRVLGLIEKHPGSRVSDLQIESRMTTGAFYYHLNHLKQAGLVEVVTTGKVSRVYPAGKVIPHEEGPLDSETGRDVARLLLRKPRSTEEVADLLGIAPRTARVHLHALMRAGMAIRMADGWTRTYEATARLRDAWNKEK